MRASTSTWIRARKSTNTSEAGFRARLLRAAADPRILWAVAIVFWGRDVLFWALPHDRADARVMLSAGRLFVRDPSHLYTATIAVIERTRSYPVPGVEGTPIQPPAVALLTAPLAALPKVAGVAIWTAGDAVCLLLGLFLLARSLKLRGAALPLFWLVAGYFPPLFAEVDAGQVGGYVLLAGTGSALLAAARPDFGGVLAGVGAALKIYPGAMFLGVGPRRGPVFLATTVLAGAGIWLLAAIPMGGPGALVQYVTHVVVGTEQGTFAADCAVNSVSTLFGRTVGGDRYAYINGTGGLSVVQLPLHAPAVGTALTFLVIGALVIACVWAAWRSGWEPLYGPLLAFGLGALVPSEVYPYQFLPILPITLIVGVGAIRNCRAAVLLTLAAGLLLFVREPCATPLPNVWTLGALLLFGICCSQAGSMRRGE